eukprot:Hpha_TRINITY_DN10898_c0_g1::TRINITY_DN10898_c0_g1_i1::g.23423::m.23423
MDAGEAVQAWTRYKLVKALGAGSFGQVYLVDGVAEAGGQEGQHVAKRIPIAEVPQKVVESSANEVYVLTVLSHPNIVRYHDHFVDTESFLNIITEYCSCGDLQQEIERRRGSSHPFSEKELVYLLFQLLIAIRYIHSMEVMHRDLKPGNIFLTDGLGVKVGDFGISKMMSSGSMAQTMVGTPFYFSPEVSTGEDYTHPADMWSLGCVVYESAALQRPFNGNNILAIVQAITSGVYKPLPESCPHRIVEAIGKLLVVKPQLRATADGLLEEYFAFPLDDAVKAELERRAKAQQGTGG